MGVAPAFGIVYAVGGALHRLWSGSTGRGRFGGKRRRVRVWLAVRYAGLLAHDRDRIISIADPHIRNPNTTFRSYVM